jgi:hypothetical protein
MAAFNGPSDVVQFFAHHGGAVKGDAVGAH